MGFPAPPRLKPWLVDEEQRELATILRAAGKQAAWVWVDRRWCILAASFEDRWSIVRDGRTFMTYRSYRNWRVREILKESKEQT